MRRQAKMLLLSGIWGVAFYFWWRNKEAPITASGALLEAKQEADIIMAKLTGNPTCGERNNNPGNIRPGSPWQGMTGTAKCGSSGEFVVFSSPVYGIRAIGKDLLTKYSRGLDTVRKIINVYAPPSENLTGSYISAVAKALGVGPDSPLNLTEPHTLIGFVRAIIQHENGRVIYSDQTISEAVNLALR